jgi:hypothetical protein
MMELNADDRNIGACLEIIGLDPERPIQVMTKQGRKFLELCEMYWVQCNAIEVTELERLGHGILAVRCDESTQWEWRAGPEFIRTHWLKRGRFPTKSAVLELARDSGMKAVQDLWRANRRVLARHNKRARSSTRASIERMEVGL